MHALNDPSDPCSHKGSHEYIYTAMHFVHTPYKYIYIHHTREGLFTVRFPSKLKMTNVRVRPFLFVLRMCLYRRASHVEFIFTFLHRT